MNEYNFNERIKLPPIQQLAILELAFLKDYIKRAENILACWENKTEDQNIKK